MALETDDFLALLKRHDVAAETAGRIRREARARLSRRPSAVSRVYDRIMEPVLVLGAVIASLSWALDRINLLTR